VLAKRTRTTYSLSRARISLVAQRADVHVTHGNASHLVVCEAALRFGPCACRPWSRLERHETSTCGVPSLVVFVCGRVTPHPAAPRRTASRHATHVTPRASQLTPHALPHVTPRITPRVAPHVTPRVTAHVTARFTPRVPSRAVPSVPPRHPAPRHDSPRHGQDTLRRAAPFGAVRHAAPRAKSRCRTPQPSHAAPVHAA